MSVHQTKNGRWFAQYYEVGKTSAVRRYFGRGELARQKAVEFDHKVKAVRTVEPGAITVRDLLTAYHNQHLVSSTTLVSDAYRLDRIIIPALGHLPAESVPTKAINLFVKYRIDEGRAIATVKRDLDLLKAAYAWGERQIPPLVHVNPLSKYQLRRPDEKDVPLPPTEDEIRGILRHSMPHLARAILLGWYTGARPGREWCRLRWSDVDLDNRRLRIVSARKGGPVTRIIPISQHLHSTLSAWLIADRKLSVSMATPISSLPLIHYKGKAVLSLKKSWKAANASAGITRKLRLYDIRHHFATDLLESGYSGGVVSQLMGHSREDTTLHHYNHVRPEHAQKAVDSIPDLQLGSDHYLGITAPQNHHENPNEIDHLPEP